MMEKSKCTADTRVEWKTDSQRTNFIQLIFSYVKFIAFLMPITAFNFNRNHMKKTNSRSGDGGSSGMNANTYSMKFTS